MRLSVIGCGYLGAVHAAAMASLGHDVVGIDVDAARIEALSRGEAPFFEPDLQGLLTAGIASGRLTFTTDMSRARGADVHFLAVGTPQRKGSHAADLAYVDAAVDALLPQLRPGDVVAGKSTVPVGTAARLAPQIDTAGATLVWNPEFLREGWAVKDTIEPDRLVVGAAPGARGEAAADTLRRVYEPAVAAGIPFLVVDWATAELVKVAANAFLATKISFINAMAEIAEVAGADVTQLADALGYDTRIGRRYLGAGIGFGAAASPRTSAPSRRGPKSSGAARRWRSCARWTPSTCAGGTAPSGSWSKGCGAHPTASGSRCWAPPSSRSATTCATRPHSRSPCV